ncbi:hypothetical protein ACH4T9_31050 [Micromonospora sp. NPDC020750]|uniref:hypothetical protein n=1 Tax=unclassified Micromonospora TaxID=2617518 RepID=UPI0037A3C50A
MTIDDLRQVLTLAEDHRTVVITAAGVAMLTLSALGWWVRKRLKGKADVFGRFCDAAAVVIAIALSAEGMWEVATERMHFGPDKALLLFAFAELAMMRSARRARAKVAKSKRPGVYGVMVWSIALGSGVIASLNAPNAAEFGVRLAAPALVAGQWWADLLDDLREKLGGERQESNWILTPQRVGVWLGLLKPGAADDLSDVYRQRRIVALVDAGLELRAQEEAAKNRPAEPAKASRWRKRADPLVAARQKVQRLTKSADRADVAAAREQLLLTLNAERELFRADDQPTDTERQLMDELRLVMRQATDRLRVDHARAFGLNHARTTPAEPQWSNGLVQMRSSIADQIRTAPVGQPASPVRTSAVDQTEPRDLVHARTNPAPVDQPATSAVVPATRTTPAQRTTARVDRARPVSPAAGGEIPPRIRDMVRDLKRAYRGDIPGRRTVMDRMGWSSAGDAQTAINLVRAERTKTTEEQS